MNQSIELILADVVDKMNLNGYNCSGQIATRDEFYRISKVSDSIFPAFLFQVMEETINTDTYLQTVVLRFVLCFSSEETGNTIDVKRFQDLRKYYTRFVNEVRKHENEDGQQLIEITRLRIVPYYFDMKFLDVQTKGYACDMTITIQPTNLC